MDTAATLNAESLPPGVVAQILDMATQSFVVHRGGLPLFVNNVTADMLGVRDKSQSFKKTVLEWIHPDDRASVSRNIAARMEGRSAPQDQQFRLAREDGAEIWVDCRATVVDWPGGPAILATLIDITQLKQTERAHVRSDALFKRVFQATPDMMSLSYLRTGVFLDVNDNLANAIGMSRRKILGQSIFDLAIWGDPTVAIKIGNAIRTDGSIRQMEASVRRVDGTIFPVKFSAELLNVDGEEVILIIGRDITDEKKSEEELRNSRDMAELANRTKSEFLANMSHELRTPLNAILGFSEIIKGEVLGPLGDARYRDYANDVHRSGTHLLDIINDILDLSKVEAGRLEIYPSEVDVSELVAQCIRLIRELAHQAGLRLVSRIEPDEFSLFVDRRLFKQILLNLLSNAVKFTEQGGHIAINALALPDGGCKLIVTDTGVGMSKEEIERAMTPFGQVDGVMTRRHQGTGLGLPLIAAFVDVHEGTLHIDSEKNVGTTVTIVLPDQMSKD